MKKYIVFITVFLMLVSTSLQAGSLQSVQQKLTQHQLIRGDFKQTKTLQMFNQPLLSEGNFLLHHQKGLWWQQHSPFAVSLVLADDKLSQQFADKPAQVIEAKDNPMVFYFSHLFLSLFKGDVSALSEQFSVQLKQGETQWLLTLVPKTAPLDKVFARIRIVGDDYIQQLTLEELSGDQTEIEFFNQQNSPEQLTADETRALQL